MTAASAHDFSATSRTVTGKQVRALRRDGQLPAVIYGHNKATRALTVNAHDFHRLFAEAGSTSLVSLSVDDAKPIKVLIHDVQVNPAHNNQIQHVDFYEVNLKEKLQTAIPLVLVGTSEAVEVQDGTLITVKDELEVECLPDNLVQEIEIDITPLKTFDDVIKVSDVVAPTGITILNDPEETLISVTAPRTDAEMEEDLNEPVAEGETTFDTDSGTSEEATGEEKAE